MLPAVDGREDAVWVCGPDEGFGIGIVFLNEAVDGGLQIDEGTEDPAL
jgi:hypothetical protein